MNTDFKKGLKAGVPIALGYIAVSFSFGILAISCGLSVWQAVLISMTNLTSAGQLAGVQTMALPQQYVSMFVSQLTINVRYAFMSVSLSQKTDERFSGVRRWLLGFFMTDEIFAVASAQKSVSASFFLGLSVLPFFGWALGTLCGALLGGLLPAAVTNALCIALYAMFVAVVVPEGKANVHVLSVALAAAAFSCALYYGLPALSSGLGVSLAAVAAATLLALLRPVQEEADG